MLIRSPLRETFFLLCCVVYSSFFFLDCQACIFFFLRHNGVVWIYRPERKRKMIAGDLLFRHIKRLLLIIYIVFRCKILDLRSWCGWGAEAGEISRRDKSRNPHKYRQVFVLISFLFHAVLTVLFVCLSWCSLFSSSLLVLFFQISIAYRLIIWTGKESNVRTGQLERRPNCYLTEIFVKK